MWRWQDLFGAGVLVGWGETINELQQPKGHCQLYHEGVYQLDDWNVPVQFDLEDYCGSTATVHPCTLINPFLVPAEITV